MYFASRVAAGTTVSLIRKSKPEINTATSNTGTAISSRLMPSCWHASTSPDRFSSAKPSSTPARHATGITCETISGSFSAKYSSPNKPKPP